MVHCLRQKTEDELLEVAQKTKFGSLDFLGDPRESYCLLHAIIDGVVLPKAPEEILAEKNFNTVLYIVGITKKEFGWSMPMNISESLIPAVIEKYISGTDNPIRKKDFLQDLMGDVMFGAPSVIVSRHHRDTLSVAT
ncbi:hypothetical protein U0070_023879 [Myodes glareolus]|uniref:Carboxylesterase type B domain-containing protein n=1 Tax=Myodes glareolus TaxID=447135 RepID=A0AAW0HW37_MYOGA